MVNHDFNCQYCMKLAELKKLTIKKEDKKKLTDSVKSNEEGKEALMKSLDEAPGAK